MPGFRSHYFFGDMSARDYAALPGCIQKHRNVYNLGEQGPDIFFYSPQAHLFYPHNIGFLMHKEKVNDFFRNLFAARKELSEGSGFDIDIADAYICGFMGHYTLDTICHPYIHYRSEKKKYLHDFTQGFGIHVLLETDIDNDNVRHFLGCEPSAFNNWDTIKVTKAERDVVAKLLCRAIALTYPDNVVKEKHIRSAITFSRKLFHMMHEKGSVKKKLVMGFDKLFFHHIFLSSIISNDHLHAYDDPCNLTHREYKNPWDPSILITKDFYEMMEEARELYHQRIELYAAADFDALLSHLGDLSYDSGLPLPLTDPVV